MSQFTMGIVCSCLRGTKIKPASCGKQYELPIITGMDDAEIAIGQRAEGLQQLTQKVATLPDEFLDSLSGFPEGNPTTNDTETRPPTCIYIQSPTNSDDSLNRARSKSKECIVRRC